MSATQAIAPPIEIVQDCEYDEDEGLGQPMPVFWTAGHGHSAREFVRAVVDHCLDETGQVPRISYRDCPREVWQMTVSRGPAVEYLRINRPAGQERGWDPVTLLDLTRTSRGAIRCSASGCDQPGRAGSLVRVPVAASPQAVPSLSVGLWLCAEHAEQVPAGAEIVLPAAKEADDA